VGHAPATVNWISSSFWARIYGSNAEKGYKTTCGKDLSVLAIGIELLAAMGGRARVQISHCLNIRSQVMKRYHQRF
jgi:hypothetical protein